MGKTIQTDEGFTDYLAQPPHFTFKETDFKIYQCNYKAN